MKDKVKTYIGYFSNLRNSVNLMYMWIMDANMCIVAIYIQTIVSLHLYALKNKAKESHLYYAHITQFENVLEWSSYILSS